ncbi:MAG: hydrogenase, partial [Deltaproteobacteria bacterium]|nr:hydrogenase [Deltaproteobacteria bacterium]
MDKEITYREVNADVVDTMTKTGPMYYLCLLLAACGFVVFWLIPWVYQIYYGQGVTGLNTPSFWGVYLTNFVFWIGISHSG